VATPRHSDPTSADLPLFACLRYSSYWLVSFPFMVAQFLRVVLSYRLCEVEFPFFVVYYVENRMGNTSRVSFSREACDFSGDRPFWFLRAVSYPRSFRCDRASLFCPAFCATVFLLTGVSNFSRHLPDSFQACFPFLLPLLLVRMILLLPTHFFSLGHLPGFSAFFAHSGDDCLLLDVVLAVSSRFSLFFLVLLSGFTTGLLRAAEIFTPTWVAR